MRLVRCNVNPGHYYDGDVCSECPECARNSKKSNDVQSSSKENIRVKTISLEQLQQIEDSSSGLVDCDNVEKYEDLHNNSEAPKSKHNAVFGKIFSRKKEKNTGVTDENALKKNDEKSFPSIASEVAAVQSTNQVNSGKTVAYYNFGGSEPVVGWLVCLNGIYKGESFVLKSGQNFIGRSLNMNIVLKDETSVSRENHAMIMYDPKHNVFHLIPGQSTGITYLNDDALLMPAVLKSYDVIALGECLLSFIPFCSEQFNWDNYKS